MTDETLLLLVFGLIMVFCLCIDIDDSTVRKRKKQMDKSKQKDIWLLARNALYDLEQAEIKSVREKLRKIMELSKDEGISKP